jgi:hypothetical protein
MSGYDQLYVSHIKSKYISSTAENVCADSSAPGSLAIVSEYKEDEMQVVLRAIISQDRDD